MANRPGYFKTYYSEKKDEILKGRQDRYKSDPEYRDRVLKSSRDYRTRQRNEPRIKMPRHQRPLVLQNAEGKDVHLFSVGFFGVLLQRSVQALNHWERNGLMPPTPYRDTRGFRYFTRSMMVAVRDEVGTKKRLFPVDPTMCQRIRERWVASGVPMDEIPVGTLGTLEEAVAKTVVTSAAEAEAVEAEE